VKDSQFYLSPEEEKKHYEKHNNDVNNSGYQNFTAPVTQFVLQNQKHSDKGLDFGSGTGPVISKMLLDKGFTITQYDLYFEPFKERLNTKYDYIVCSEVWEHFQQSEKELIQLRKMLNKNGRLIVMTLLYSDEIDFETWHYRLDITHVFIYRKKTMEFIAAKFNLELELITDRLIVFKTKIEL
jgi:2-polyprenyl-3-methyl-5-hydroxy-6-metoxy-1,4-benzoquinol methylase